MVTIGNDTLPGGIYTIESSTSTGVNATAPGVGVIVGQADLSSGTASANEAHRINTPRAAKDTFGDGSLLAIAIEDALAEGAYPVYGIAPEETDVTAEDISGESGDTATLANAPCIEDADSVTFTINSTTKTTVIVLDGDPSNQTPGTDEVLFNPVTGKYHSDESLGTAGDEVDYTHYDYPGAFDALQTEKIGDDNLTELVDFVVCLNENDTVVNDHQTTLGEMENSMDLAIGIAGAGDPYIDDAGTSSDESSSYTNSFDDSRMQLYNPSRNSDGESVLGSVLGLRSRLGINASPMFKKLSTQKDLQITLSTTQKENLVGERVNPLQERSAGAKVIEDLTTVDTSSNSEEANYDQGLSRLVTDAVAEFVEANVEPYIGQLHIKATRDAFRSVVVGYLRTLLASNSITAFSVNVDEVDSTTASLDVGIKTVEPLRNIEATITSGEVA